MRSPKKPLSTRERYNREEARDSIPGSLSFEAGVNGWCGPLGADSWPSLANITRIAILILGTLAIAYAARSVVVPVLLA